MNIATDPDARGQERSWMTPRSVAGLALLVTVLSLLWFKASTAWFFALFL
jgi:hypothetical protein